MSTRAQIPMKPTAAPARTVTPAPFGTLQRKCACGGSGSSGSGCEECKKKKLQRSAVGTGPAIAPPMVHDVLRSPGRPLDAATRASMEPRFGHDFSKVRIHADARANESARSVNALAYTVGPQIVFGAGLYQPGAASGQRLLAHELTHVVQQQGQSADGHPLRVGPSTDSYEQEAERAASVIASGRSVDSTQPGSGLVQRQAAPSPSAASAAPGSGAGSGEAAPATASVPKPEPCEAPKDLACLPSKEPVSAVTNTSVFPVDSAVLTPAQEKAIDAIAASWSSKGAAGVLRVDGYASAEYECVYNWHLSCKRAQAVAAELESPSDGSKGVPAGSIALFAHGESDDAGAALAPNRRATISMPNVPEPKHDVDPKPEPSPKPKGKGTPWGDCRPEEDQKCCAYRQQLLNTVDRWAGEEYTFGAAVLRVFITQGHSEDVGNQFQQYAKEIADSELLHDGLRHFLGIAGYERLQGDKTSADLSTEPAIKFNVNYLPPFYTDLFYALGGAHFTVTKGTITKEPSFFRGLVCRYNVANLEWQQKDYYTFPHGTLRDRFDDYVAAEYLEEQCGHKAFWHYETGAESTYCVP